MGKLVSIDQNLSFDKKEWDLLSFFLQNARTLCARLSEEMERKEGLQEYATLLHSLWGSLDHAFAVAKSYAEKESVALQEARKLVLNLEQFTQISGKILSKVERNEIAGEVGKLKEDLGDADVEEVKLQQVVLGVEGQWKKVVSLITNNLGPYKKELGTHFEMLESMTARFDKDFSGLLEEQKGLKIKAFQELHDFLSDIEAKLMRGRGEQISRELGLAA